MTGYVFDFKGHGQFDPDGPVKVDDVGAHNRALAEAELAHWRTCPYTFRAYVGRLEVGANVTLWPGDPIGTISALRTWTRSDGAPMARVSVRGSNGALYWGTHGYATSQLLRLRRYK